MQLLLVLSYTLLGIALFWSNGFYIAPALVLTLISFVLLLFAGWLSISQRNIRAFIPQRFLFPGALLVLIGIQFFKAPAFYIEQWYRPFVMIMLGLSGIGVLVAGALKERNTIRKRILGVLFLLGAVCYILIPLASEAPLIDVWHFSQESADHLLSGLPPYSTPVTDLYNNHETFGVPQGYIYLPGTLYPITLSYLLTGDVRFLYVFSVILGAILLWLMAQKTMKENADWIPLLFLFHPRGLFVVEQSWTEPFMLLLFFLFLWLHTSDSRRGMISVVYGYFLSLKQSLLFFPLHFLMIERRPKQLMIAAGVVLLTFIPFLITDSRGLWENGVLHNLLLPGRLGVLNVTSYLAENHGVETSLWLSLGSGLIFAIATFFLLRKSGLTGYLFAVTITTFAIFLFGKQALCNYYYFVSGLMVALIVFAAQDEGRVKDIE